MQKDNSLGARLGELRRKNGWTLGKVSEMTGVGISTLSKVENQMNGASFDTLLRLSKGLGVNFDDLLNPGREPVPGLRAVTIRGEGLKFGTPQYAYTVHAGDLARKKMIPLLMTVHARDIAEFQALSSHEGEEFIYVTKGEVEMHTEHYAPRRLRSGDSIYFDSSTPHAFISVGRGSAEMLSMCLGGTRDFEQVKRQAAT